MSVKQTMNQYKIIFNNKNIGNNYIQIVNGIFANNDCEAMDIVKDTWNVSKNWIISSSVSRLNVPVIKQDGNIYKEVA
jgi:hypothetical protein